MATILKKDKQSGLILERDGQTLVCPFRNPIPIPGNLTGSISFSHLPCASNCPHFEHDEKNGSVFLSCGNEMRVIKVEAEPKLESKSGLIVN